MKPTIELKKIRLHKGLSQETPAYTADVYVDGTLFCHTENSGHGGGDSFYAPKGVNKPNFHQVVEKLDKLIGETYPKHTYKSEDGEHSFDECLEVLCHTFVWEDDAKKTFKRHLKTKVRTIEVVDGERCVLVYKAKPSQHAKEHFDKKPNTIYLNGLPFDEAWKLVMEVEEAQTATA